MSEWTEADVRQLMALEAQRLHRLAGLTARIPLSWHFRIAAQRLEEALGILTITTSNTLAAKDSPELAKTKG